MSYSLVENIKQAPGAPDYSNPPGGSSYYVRLFTSYLFGPSATNRSAPPEADYSVFIPARAISFSGSVPLGGDFVSMASLRQFESLVERWNNEAGHFSIVQESIAHPAYLEIIGMRERALPLLMAKVNRGSAQWFPALRAIAGPTRPNEGDSLEETFRAWKTWWEERRKYAGVDFSH